MEAKSKWETKKVGTAASIWRHQNPQLKVLWLVLTLEEPFYWKCCERWAWWESKNRLSFSHCFSNFIHTFVCQFHTCEENQWKTRKKKSFRSRIRLEGKITKSPRFRITIGEGPLWAHREIKWWSLASVMASLGTSGINWILFLWPKQYYT